VEKFMFFRRMKINKNYENQLLCGNVFGGACEEKRMFGMSEEKKGEISKENERVR
jgi:hypothetical protein